VVLKQQKALILLIGRQRLPCDNKAVKHEPSRQENKTMITRVRNTINREQASDVYIFNENDTKDAPVLKWLIGRRIICPRCGCDRDGQYGIARIARASETDAWFYCQNCDTRIKYHRNPSGSILGIIESRD
jgi:hypothetical protein